MSVNRRRRMYNRAEHSHPLVAWFLGQNTSIAWALNLYEDTNMISERKASFSPNQIPKKCYSSHHIESCDTCMEH